MTSISVVPGCRVVLHGEAMKGGVSVMTLDGHIIDVHGRTEGLVVAVTRYRYGSVVCVVMTPRGLFKLSTERFAVTYDPRIHGSA